MGLSGKAEPIDMLLHHVLGFFNSFRNFNLLLPCQQRHLAHLFEIHADRIIQNIEFCLRLLFFLFFVGLLLSVFVAIDFGGFDDVDLHSPQLRENGIQFFGIGDGFRQRIIKIIKRDVALLLRQLG